jgi:plastocyanin
MIKINSDPKVYAVDENGELRWVMSEEIAIDLYGTSWNTMIDDVPDAFFGNYRIGPNVERADDFVPSDAAASAENISQDKSLKSATVLNVSDDSYDNASVTIKAGTAVRWFNNGTSKHTATGNDLSWGTGTIQSGGNFARYFHAPGTYEFFCSYHPEMKATLIVE